MTASSRKPRWLWRIGLAALPTAAWFFEFCPLPVFPRPSISHELRFEVRRRCLVIGQLPSTETIEHVHAVWDERRRWYADEAKAGRYVDRGWGVIEGEAQAIDPSYVCDVIRGSEWPFFDDPDFPGFYRGQYVTAIAFWLLATPLSLFYLPLLRGFWLTWRSARRRRQDRCAACSYSLYALESACCPECGESISTAAESATPAG